MSIRRLVPAASILSASLLFACGGAFDSVKDPDPGASSGGASSGGASSGGASSSDPGDPGGPRVFVVLQGTTASFAHADGFAGETPRREIVAVKSLWLHRSPADANPVKVFEHGDAPVEAELVSGKPTEVAKVAAKGLPAGVFTMARVGVSYVKYAVDATMHAPPAFPGHYDNVQALSDGAIIDGAPRKKGFFKYTFVANGASVGTLQGEDAPTPVASSGGGITMDMSGPETFYVFPVTVAVDPSVTVDHEAKLVANVFESFRWQDDSLPGYAPNVFDTTPSAFEPVMAFGANAFTLTVAAR